MENNVQNELRALSIIHIAMVAGQLIFFGVIFFIQKSTGGALLGNTDEMGILLQVLPILALMPLPAGFFLYNLKAKEAMQIEENEKKLALYKSGFILKLAIIESSVFLSLVGFLLTAAPFFWIIFLIGIAVMVLSKPSISKLMSDFGYR